MEIQPQSNDPFILVEDWNLELQEMHNNFLETLASTETIKNFILQRDLRDGILLHKVDNTTAVSYLSKQGGRFPHISAPVQELWHLCLGCHIKLKSAHIPKQEVSTTRSVGSLSSGLLCNTVQHSSPTVLLMVEGSKGSGLGCNDSTMAQQLLPIPSIHSSGLDLEENPTGETSSHSDHSSLGGSSLVASHNATSSGSSSGSPCSIDGSGSEAPTTEVELTRMEIVRGSLRISNFSDKVIEMVDRSWGTSKAADSHWKLFSDWCRSKDLDPLSKSEVNLLNWCGDRPGNKQATYKNYELTVRRVWDFVSLTTHPSDTLRRLFMRGVEITNPTVPRYEDVFDISILLKYVEENLINSDLTIHLRDACILFFRIFKLNRSSEVAHIMLKELDWDSDSYKWLGEKTHVGRIMSGEVALPAAYQQFDIRPLLKKYLK